MSEVWLSRARLRQSAPVATLVPLLMPDASEDRVSAGHRLIWSLFARGDSRERDFLWREDASACYYILSATRPPEDHPLLEVDPPKRFAPALAAGDRLRFSLRANPTVARPRDEFRTVNRAASAKPSRKTVRHDVVMDAIHRLPTHERAPSRTRAIQSAGRAWLERTGERCGFRIPPHATDEGEVEALRVDGYRVLRPPRARRSDQMRVAVIDFEGFLTVTDPDLFVASLARGIGRAKAYGCGLMLIARA